MAMKHLIAEVMRRKMLDEKKYGENYEQTNREVNFIAKTLRVMPKDVHPIEGLKRFYKVESSIGSCKSSRYCYVETRNTYNSATIYVGNLDDHRYSAFWIHNGEVFTLREEETLEQAKRILKPLIAD